MYSDTRDKLREAQFFFGKMEQSISQSDPFRWFLSAFLSATRSLTDIMGKEYKTKNGFRNWMREKVEKLESGNITKYFRELRDIAIHQSPIKGYDQSFFYEDAKTEEPVRLSYLTGTASTIKPIAVPFPPPTLDKQPDKGHLWYFDDCQDEDVLTLCKMYYSELESLVKECESNFSKGNSQ